MKTIAAEAAYMQNDGPVGPLRTHEAWDRRDANWHTELHATSVVEVFVRAPAAEQDAAQTRGESLCFLPFRDLERLAPYPTRVRLGWGVRW